MAIPDRPQSQKTPLACINAYTYHAFQRPRWVLNLRRNRNTVVQRNRSSRRRATANQNLDGVSVRRVLREKYRSAFHRIVSAGEEVVHSTWHVGELCDRVERHRI